MLQKHSKDINLQQLLDFGACYFIFRNVFDVTFQNKYLLQPGKM